MGKQMEGDNPRRRALARQAHGRGQQPSAAGVTLGAGKQVEHRNGVERDGPQPAGSRHKPVPARGGPALPSAPTGERTLPRPDRPSEPPTETGPPIIAYRDLVSSVGRWTGIEFDQARAAVGATVTALAMMLDDADRRRLMAAVPGQLADQPNPTTETAPRDLAGFLSEVARLSGRTPEQARYQAQATLRALADQDGQLVDSLDLPSGFRGLLTPPSTGSVVDPAGHPAPLTRAELSDAMAELPYWSSLGQRLVRTLVLPRENLDRVLGRLAWLRSEVGRGPSVARESADSAVITVRTAATDAVTGQDVELAHRVDAAIDEAGAGIA